MNKDEALRLALEVLRNTLDKPMWNRLKIEEAITAIKEALAAPVQEPVACKKLCELCVKRGYDFCANAAKTTPITSTPPAQPAPVQPVSGG